MTPDPTTEPMAGARRPGRTDLHRPQRTTAEWLDCLCGSDPRPRDGALEELRGYLRACLAKAFSADSTISDADLDDFVQDAIVRILGALDGFRGDSRFTTWTLSIAMRAAFTQLRRRRHGHVSLDDIRSVERESSLPQPAADPGREAERTELMGALRTAIDERLTERQRTVILAELKGVPSDQVAALLGTNRNAVYKVYHDARKKLRRALNEAGFDAAHARDLWEDRR